MVKELADLFRMDQFRERFTEMEGFGEKSFENLLKSAEKRGTPLLTGCFTVLAYPA